MYYACCGKISQTPCTPRHFCRLFGRTKDVPANRQAACTQRNGTCKCMSRFLVISGFLCSRGVSAQVLSAYAGLTAVFGMGTGGSLQLSPLNRFPRTLTTTENVSPLLRKLSSRPISTGPLHASLHFHSRPIYHLVSMGPYLLSYSETSSLGRFHA